MVFENYFYLVFAGQKTVRHDVAYIGIDLNQLIHKTFINSHTQFEKNWIINLISTKQSKCEIAIYRTKCNTHLTTSFVLGSKTTPWAPKTKVLVENTPTNGVNVIGFFIDQ